MTSRPLCAGLDYVVLSHVSNVTGCVSPVKEIAEIPRKRGGLLILDAAQSAGELDVDMQDLDEWADTDHLISLYPQTIARDPVTNFGALFNPYGRWD